MTYWEVLVERRRDMVSFGRLFFVGAFGCAIATYWASEAMIGAVAMTIMAMWSFSNSMLLGKMADMQAALDMRKISLDLQPRGEMFNVLPGQSLDLFGHCVIRLDRSARMEIIR